MPRPYLYIAEVARDAIEPQVFIARLASRAAGLREDLRASGSSPEAADLALREALTTRLRQPCYPINVHLVPEGYFCTPCALLLLGRSACTEHRRSKHSLTSALP